MTQTPVHRAWLVTAFAAVSLLLLLAAPKATPEQASSEARRAQAGYLDAGDEHTCAILADRSVRCWGKGLAGRLGYGNENNVLSPAAAGPVPLPAGRNARALVSSDYHTCAILDDGSVRCWGFGANGRLGYGNANDVLLAANAPPVDLGPGRTATAIAAGASHTCAILDDGTVRCWGNGVSGRLGYGNQASIGDNETPAAAGPVDIGAGRKAVAISAGDFHTCVIRDDARLVCWGFGAAGQLGYGGTGDIGDDETPGSVGPVDLNGHGVRAVSAGKGHTCVILDDGTVHCWGFGADGRLGYGGTANILSASAAPAVNLGPGRTATAIAAGEAHTCAILDNGAVRCWGFGGNGRLGTNATDSIGNDPGETPASVPPVNLGAGRTARAITVGFSHTCAALDDGTIRCWGFGGDGRLGYGNENSVADSPTRSIVLAGPVPLGGGVAPTAADLSLTMSVGAAQIPLGGSTSVTLRIVNRGPDTTDGVAVTVAVPAGLGLGGAAPTQGDFAAGAGLWRVGLMTPGAAASVTIPVSASTAGTRVLAAEVTSSSIFDPTSTPGNGATEDDRASVTLDTPPPAKVADARVKARRLGVKVVRHPTRGRATRLSVSGALSLPARRPALRCSGTVRAQAKVGRRVVASGTTRLRTRKGVCAYALTLRPRRTKAARAVSVTATFLGNAQVRPQASRPLKVRIR